MTQPLLNGQSAYTESGSVSAPSYTVGDCLVVFVTIPGVGTATVTQITDNLGGTYALQVSYQSGTGSSDMYVGIFTRMNCPSGITTISMTGSGINLPPYPFMQATSWTGVQSIGQSTGRAGGSSGTATSLTDTLVTTSPQSMIVGVCAKLHNGTITIPYGTVITNDASGPVCSAYQGTFAVGSTYHYILGWDWSASGSDEYAGAVLELVPVPDMVTMLDDTDNVWDKEDALVEWSPLGIQEGPLAADNPQMESMGFESSAEQPDTYQDDPVDGTATYEIFEWLPLADDVGNTEVSRQEDFPDAATYDGDSELYTSPIQFEVYSPPYDVEDAEVNRQDDGNAVPEVYNPDWYDTAGFVTWLIPSLPIVPPFAYVKPQVVYDIVVSIEWSTGTAHYGGRDFAIPYAGNPPIGVEGRLVKTSSIVLSTDTTSDSASITLDNTGFDGGATIESNWSDAHPLEGTKVEIAYYFDGEDWSRRTILLYGEVAEGSDLTDREVDILVHGVDAVLPDQINTEINLTQFPTAPRASVGQMQQMVFGSVVRMEGIPVTTIGKTQTLVKILSTDTVIPVGDVTQLPATGGTVLIGGSEQVTYTGISFNELTGCTRGVNGTTPADFGSGIEVLQLAELDILIAKHNVFAITQVWGVASGKIAPLDVSQYSLQLGSALSPAMVKFATGWPTIPVPSGSLAPQQVQMDTPTTSDTAQGSLGACGNAAGWTPKTHATVTAGNPSFVGYPRCSIQRTLPIVPNGDIVRVYVVVEYDSDMLAGESDKIAIELGTGTTQFVGCLVPGGVAPTQWIDLLGLTSLTAYNGSHQHNVPSTGDTIETCYAGGYSNGGSAWWSVPAHLHDGDTGTSDTSTQPSSSSFGYGIEWNTFAISTTQVGKTLVRVQANCKFSTGASVNSGASCQLQLFITGVGLVASVALPINLASQAAATYTTPWFDTSNWTDFNNMYAVVQFSVSSMGAIIYETWLSVEWASNAAATNLVDGTGYGTPAVFDITTIWGNTVNNPKGGTWDWFVNNPNSAINAIALFDGGGVTNIVRMYFCVSQSAYKLTPCDRVLADVQGLAPGGLPTDVLLSALDMVGLPNQNNGTDFINAANALSSISYRQDFVVYKKISGANLIQMICDEARLRCFWEDGLLSIVFLPDLADLPAPASIWGDNDLKDELLPLTRTPISKVYTLLNATYNYDGFIKTEAKALVSSLTVALSTRRATVTYQTIADTTSATLLAASQVERNATPRYQLKATFLLAGLSLRRGSIIQVTAGRRTYKKVEITEVSIQDQYVTITGTVWDTI